MLKMFTLFEHSSMSIVFLLSCLFQNVSVCKPIMSTPGNSETYVVARGFNGISQEHLVALLDRTGVDWPSNASSGEHLSLIPKDSFDDVWMEEMLKCSSFFAKLQTSAIERNIRLFNASSSDVGAKICKDMQVQDMQMQSCGERVLIHFFYR